MKKPARSRERSPNPLRHRKGCRCQLVALWLLAAHLSVSAATIHVSAAGFSPSFINVLTNETVTWVADDAGPYTITIWSGVWAPIYLEHQGSTASVTPIYSGHYDYGDDHGHSGMFYVNVPPTVESISPTNNAVFIAPATFDFKVAAHNSDEDKLMAVEVFLDSADLGRSPNGLISVPVTDLGPGTYTLSAVAIDFSDGLATNSIRITVREAKPLLLLARMAGSQLVLDVSGAVAGKSIVLESTTNLVHPSGWLPLQTNAAAPGPISFMPPMAEGPCFFRAWQPP